MASTGQGSVPFELERAGQSGDNPFSAENSAINHTLDDARPDDADPCRPAVRGFPHDREGGNPIPFDG